MLSGPMYIVLVLMAIGFGAFLISGLISGIVLGLRYVQLLVQRKPMPPWTGFLRIGWFAFFAGMSVRLYFLDNGDLIRLGNLALFTAIACWLIALYDWRRKP